MKVANTILEQLGGQKFLAMTGANHLVADGNTLRMALPKNSRRIIRIMEPFGSGMGWGRSG